MSHPHITTAQRRARLVARHHLGASAPDALAAIRGSLAMHSSDPITPYLGVWARVEGFEATDLDAALHEGRSLWRMHAMRRTLFVVDAEQAPIFEAGASRALATKEVRRVNKLVGGELGEDPAPDWVSARGDEVVALLSDGTERSTSEIKASLPDLAMKVDVGSGKWATRSAIGSPLLFMLAMQAKIVRTRTSGSWRASQYAWTTPEAWFGQGLEAREPEAGRVALLRAYLERHAPATFTDIKWWSGLTVKHVRAALAALEVVTVSLDGGAQGFVLPDDVESDDALDPGCLTMLPGLDPAPMSYKERAWFLGEHAPRLFDRNGNIGPTLWCGGRIVGGWAQRPSGEVAWELLEDVGEEARRGFGVDAERLESWLEGVTVTPRFRTPLEHELSAL